MYGPEFEEYSGDSLKIVSNMVENRTNVLELWINDGIFATDKWWYSCTNVC